MKMKKSAGFLLTTVALAVSLTGCAALTQTGSEPDVGAALTDEQIAAEERWNNRFHKKVYAATGLGYSWLEPDTSEVPGWDVNDRGNAGGQITVGADLNKRLSLELHSADLGSAGLSPTGRINYHLHGGSALVYAGKNRHNNGRRGLTGYGRIGLGMLENSPVGNVDYQKDNATHVLFGAGVEYATRIGLGVRAEVISYEEDVQYGQLGLIYRLGKGYEQKPVEIVEAPAPEPVPVAAVPEPEPVIDPCEQISGVLEGVNFHSDSAKLTSSATGILDGVSQTLSECPSVPVQITAHTDSQGSDDYNQNLSERRATSVATYLSNQGIDIGRISSSAYGESQPIDTNETPEGRLRNRRVELIAR